MDLLLISPVINILWGLRLSVATMMKKWKKRRILLIGNCSIFDTCTSTRDLVTSLLSCNPLLTLLNIYAAFMLLLYV